MSTTPTPAPMTGRRAERDGESLLVIERQLRAPIDDVWAACTDPVRMQRWIGTWSGDPASGSISFRMTAEGEDVEAEEMDVLACDPPHRFVVRGREPQAFTEDGSGERIHWEMELELSETDGLTSLRFVQVLAPGETGREMVASVGPGWDYYLDRLVAAVAGGDVDAVDWEVYAPGSAYYREHFA
ncbi:SRPBCC family protein [Nocardioides hwasunensis]|uniref:SRPBCC family protein n=1 Tax=Nocardioides hwasunensis TaxID=397258 RepID=A0ABR8MHT8_9ACTN|nr:SRPBCC family protein [Nocardioides hwasunensis]MBD3915130.1 SRPBCC family protein [Nocardioides hwasunensis]